MAGDLALWNHPLKQQKKRVSAGKEQEILALGQNLGGFWLGQKTFEHLSSASTIYVRRHSTAELYPNTSQV